MQYIKIVTHISIDCIYCLLHIYSLYISKDYSKVMPMDMPQAHLNAFVPPASNDWSAHEWRPGDFVRHFAGCPWQDGLISDRNQASSDVFGSLLKICNGFQVCSRPNLRDEGFGSGEPVPEPHEGDRRNAAVTRRCKAPPVETSGFFGLLRSRFAAHVARFTPSDYCRNRPPRPAAWWEARRTTWSRSMAGRLAALSLMCPGRGAAFGLASRWLAEATEVALLNRHIFAGNALQPMGGGAEQLGFGRPRSGAEEVDGAVLPQVVRAVPEGGTGVRGAGEEVAERAACRP